MNAPSRGDRVPNPVTVYLDTLRPSGRRNIRTSLNRAVSIFTDDAVTNAEVFDWSQVGPQHIDKLRSVMADHASTANHTLAAVRRTVHKAWELGLIDDKTRIAIEDEPNEKPQPPRGRTARYVPANEVRRLFAALDTGPIDARDAAMLTLLYGAGLLPSEAAAFQLADYDQNTDIITLRQDNSTTKRKVLATNGGKAALDSWLRVRGSHPGAFLEPVNKGGSVIHRGITGQAVMTRIRTLIAQAGLDSLSSKDLHRSYLDEQKRRLLDAGKMDGGEPRTTEMLPVPYRESSVA